MFVLQTMDNEDLLTYALVVLMIGTYILKRRTSFRWINRKYWVRPINIRRPVQGDFDHLLQELKTDSYMFFRYTRMSLSVFLSVFNHFLEMMKPFLTKKSHRALVPEQRLALTIRFVSLSITIMYIK